jgi:uncharacterized protein YuzE
MDKIKVIHDVVGHTLTLWLKDSSTEHVCEETTDEIVIMKDKAGMVLGIEILNYNPANCNWVL